MKTTWFWYLTSADNKSTGLFSLSFVFDDKDKMKKLPIKASRTGKIYLINLSAFAGTPKKFSPRLNFKFHSC